MTARSGDTPCTSLMRTVVAGVPSASQPGSNALPSDRPWGGTYVVPTRDVALPASSASVNLQA